MLCIDPSVYAESSKIDKNENLTDSHGMTWQTRWTENHEAGYCAATSRHAIGVLGVQPCEKVRPPRQQVAIDQKKFAANKVFLRDIDKRG